MVQATGRSLGCFCSQEPPEMNPKAPYLKMRSSTSVRVAPMLFRSRLTEWMAIMSPWPDSDASVPEPKERLRCSWQERKWRLREPLKLKDLGHQMG